MKEGNLTNEGFAERSGVPMGGISYSSYFLREGSAIQATFPAGLREGSAIQATFPRTQGGISHSGHLPAGLREGSAIQATFPQNCTGGVYHQTAALGKIFQSRLFRVP